MFLDKLEDIDGAVGRQNWVTRWANIGDAHFHLADLNIKKKAFDEATEAWLCALTAFEVARRLAEEDDPQSGDLSAKVEASVQRFGLSLEQRLERVQIPCCDEAEILAYYLPADCSDLCAPAVICISREQETVATLFGRLLPVVIGGGLSVLVISHDDVSNHWRGQSEMLLSCCLDYLSARPEVDASRIGVYGEGLSAVLATDFAVSDRRVAAAVCDGGLWNFTRVLASVGWMTRTANVVDEDVLSARRSRLVRQLRCPVLVVAGGRGIVSLSEAIKLQADCTEARIDLELTMPQMTQTGEIENFVSSDDRIFGWLEQKLKTVGLHNHCRPRQ
ncbi:alpha/beta hydrolase [Bradyrhizobium sp. CSA112]|uniref:alpha/beta hydrolase family protein n=1 Tax=Bradyrhizobium sp. CSA112 TaxID=2699170 RepID=UPI0023B15016|nr:alpha/beta hydrolase [Bradyrhizobium sp. CSA112]MDE5458962.1 alpha/beta hydrolase [Bradyrhizobium sp. CSA112]